MVTAVSDMATVEMDLSNDWGAGFVAGVTVAAVEALDGWVFSFTFDGEISNIWNARIVSKTGNIYVVESMAYNSSVAAGGTATFGFQAAGSTASIVPVSFNGDTFGEEPPTVAVFDGNRDDYVVVQIDADTIEITGPEGTQLFTGLETFEFADMTQTAAEVVLPRLPNLSVDEIVFDDLTLDPAQVAEISVAVQSDGVIGAGESTLDLVIASAPDFDAVIGVLDSVTLAALASGGSEAVSFTLDAGTLAPGTYWVAAVADAAGVLNEENEADNITEWVEVTVAAPLADLVLENAAMTSLTDLDLTNGGRIRMTYTVANASNYDTRNFTVTTYLSTDAVLSDDDFAVGSTTGSVARGQELGRSTDARLPETYAPGDYYLISVVNWADGTTDATPQDNVITQQITLTEPTSYAQDIAITGIEVRDTSNFETFLNGQIDLYVGLENVGRSGMTNVQLSVYLTVDGVVTDDSILLASTQRTLAVGQTRPVYVSADLDQTLASGDYTVVVVVDDSRDLNPANSIATADITIIAERETLTFTDADDVWIGTDVAAEVDLAGGDDMAIWGGAKDLVDGGAGFDTIDLTALAEGVFFVADEGMVANIQTDQNRAMWENFEKFIGSDQDDVLFLLDHVLQEINMGAGNDDVLGSAGDEIFDLGDGDDSIHAGAGDDVITTGTGADAIFFGDTEDPYLSYGGHDTITDFDVTMDVLVYVNGVEGYDPFADMVQTAEGVILNYEPGSSLLILGVQIDELVDSFIFDPDYGGEMEVGW